MVPGVNPDSVPPTVSCDRAFASFFASAAAKLSRPTPPGAPAGCWAPAYPKAGWSASAGLLLLLLLRLRLQLRLRLLLLPPACLEFPGWLALAGLLRLLLLPQLLLPLLPPARVPRE